MDVKGAFLNTIGNALNGVSKSVSAIAGALVKPLKTKLDKANEALSKDKSDMTTSDGIATKIKKLEAKRDATDDPKSKEKLNADIKNLYNKLADTKAAGGKINKAPEKSLDEQKSELLNAYKTALSNMKNETDSAKKIELKGMADAAKKRYDDFMSQHKGTNRIKDSQSSPGPVKTESVDDFFNFEMPDEFVESAVDASDIYDLLDTIM